MPTYEYECSSCGHQFEILQSITESALKKCPQCAKSKLQRLIGTGSGIIFKGSGFYETDYKRKSSSRPQETKDKDKKDKTQKGEPAQCSTSAGCPHSSSCPHSS
ncbi:MAG: zinc ribbon domain-containing protein [Candidatus Omnitrophota bacterium]